MPKHNNISIRKHLLLTHQNCDEMELARDKKECIFCNIYFA